MFVPKTQYTNGMVEEHNEEIVTLEAIENSPQHGKEKDINQSMNGEER